MQMPLFEEPTPAADWDKDVARRAIDELFVLARQYNSSQAYWDLMRFVARFRMYSPFNAMLVYTQMPGATYVAPPHRWQRDYGRRIKPNARPLVILQPMGPVMFVFDVSDTDPEDGAPPLPREIEHPFEVRAGRVGSELQRTTDNAKRDGVDVSGRNAGANDAGEIREAGSDKPLEVLVKTHPKPEFIQVPLRYNVLLNSSHTPETKYATLIHELAHLYCGHLGSPNNKWWPDRRGLSKDIREFEAESVCYLLCSRLGIDNPSAEYLANYVLGFEDTLPISLDCVMKAAGLIEQMGRERLKPRKDDD
jgi:hypothetical protein